MRTCLDCAAPLPTASRNGRPRRFCSTICNNRWRRAHPGEALPAEGGRRWDSLPDRPARRWELGPHLPLNGLDEVEVRRQRNARLLRAIAEGVEVDALCERFGLSDEAIYKIASRAGVSVVRSYLPLGGIAP